MQPEKMAEGLLLFIQGLGLGKILVLTCSEEIIIIIMSLSTVQSTFPSFDYLLLDCAKAKIASCVF